MSFLLLFFFLLSITWPLYSRLAPQAFCLFRQARALPFSIAIVFYLLLQEIMYITKEKQGAYGIVHHSLPSSRNTEGDEGKGKSAFCNWDFNFGFL